MPSVGRSIKIVDIQEDQGEFPAWSYGEFPALESLQWANPSVQNSSLSCLPSIETNDVVYDSLFTSEKLFEAILNGEDGFIDFKRRAIRLGLGHDSVSFLIPAHNEEKSLPCTVREVTESSLFRNAQKKEIIICLNGCNDRSIEVVDGLRARYPEVRAIITLEKSKNRAWELLVQESNPNSDILFLLDADIRIEPRSLTLLDNALDMSPNYVIAGAFASPCKDTHGNVSWFQQMKFEEYENPLATQRRNLFAPTLSGACYAIRRVNAVTTKMPEDPRIADDQFLQNLYDSQVTKIHDAHVYYYPPSFLDLVRQDARCYVNSKLMRTQYPDVYQDQLGPRSSPGSFDNQKFFLRATTDMKLFFIIRFASKVLGSILGEYYLRTNSDPWPVVASTKSSETQYSPPLTNAG